MEERLFNPGKWDQMRAFQLFSSIAKCGMSDVPKDTWEHTPAIFLTMQSYINVMLLIKSLTMGLECPTEQFSLAILKDIKDPDEIKYCPAGKCFNRECHCKNGFAGKYCNRVAKRCWRLACYLKKCPVPLKELDDEMDCRCERSTVNKAPWGSPLYVFVDDDLNPQSKVGDYPDFEDDPSLANFSGIVGVDEESVSDSEKEISVISKTTKATTEEKEENEKSESTTATTKAKKTQTKEEEEELSTEHSKTKPKSGHASGHSKVEVKTEAMVTEDDYDDDDDITEEEADDKDDKSKGRKSRFSGVALSCIATMLVQIYISFR